MHLLGNFVSVFLFLIWNLGSSGNSVAQALSFTVSNNSIWPAPAPNRGQAVIAKGGFYLAPAKTRKFSAPRGWNGRIWARTGCKFNSSNTPRCETCDCNGQLECNGAIGLPPVTLVEFTLQSDKSKPSFYDVSVVDGYNLPVSVSSRNATVTCNIGGCVKNLKSICPAELQVLNNKGEVVACRSACLEYNLDMFCCRNEYGSLQKCKPSLYSKFFKDACPSYVSYAFETPFPLVTCDSSDYVITFCPDKWGSQHMPT